MLWRSSPWLRADRVGRLAYSPCARPDPIPRRWIHHQTSPSKIAPLVTHSQLLRPNWSPQEKAATPSTDQHETPSLVRVAGIVRSARWKKKTVFAHIHDGTTYNPLQAILPVELATGAITNGAYVELTGEWKTSPAQGQSHELQVTALDCVGPSDAQENPIQKAAMTPQFLRTIPHMRIRTPFQALVTRARSQLTNSVSQHYFNRARPVIQVHPPLITSSDCEGAGEAFTVALPQKGKENAQSFFKDPKCLTVSSQLHLEAYCADLGDVWALSPTFRAEESDTSRHLAEFYMLEAEFRSTTTLEDVMLEVELLIRSIAQSLSDSGIGAELLDYYSDRRHRPADFESIDLANRWSLVGISAQQWPRITFAEAVSELTKAQTANPNIFVHPPSADQGLALEHERWIVDNLSPGPPIFVTNYPHHLKPFYMLPSSTTTESTNPSSPLTVACFDLLFPHGYAEVCGGSLREHRLENLIQAMRQKGLVKTTQPPSSSPIPNNPSASHNPNDVSPAAGYPYLLPNENLGSLQWYADLRRFGSSPHGGFGVGFDRLLAYLVGVGNVRDVVGFPRYWGSCHC